MIESERRKRRSLSGFGPGPIAIKRENKILSRGSKAWHRTSVMRDRLLPLLNLVLPPLQIVTTVLAFAMGTTFEQSTASPAGDPPIIPADYAFIIWSLIYSGCIAYGVFQYLPARRDEPLYRQIRPFTASAFAGTISWLVAARFHLIWLTVVCIFWMLASLLVVFMALMTQSRRFSIAEQICTVIPLSIFTGWVTVATFANTSSLLHEHGLLSVVFTPAIWAVIMTSVAGVIACWLTYRSHNVPFALTICWALVAIAVANLTREYHPVVALIAASMNLVVLAPLFRPRRSAGHVSGRQID